MPRAYAGKLIRDGWAPYDRFTKARHQQCNQHILRRCDELAAVATRGAVRFPRRVAELLRQGLALRDRYEAGEVSEHGLAVARGRLRLELERAVFPSKTDPANERLAKHLWHYLDQILSSPSYVPGLDATNWQAEQAWAGAQAQAVLMSLWRTCWQQGHTALDCLSRILRGQPALLALPP